MTGEFYNEEESNTNFITNAYEKRRPASEFFDFNNFIVPKTPDEAFSSIKFNFDRFLFYYMIILSIANFFVILSNRIIVIPIIFSAAIYYASNNDLSYNGIHFNPSYAFYGIIGVNVLLILFSPKIAYSFIYVIAFSAIAVAIILIHASLSGQTQNESNENI